VSRSFELPDVDWVTVGTVGEPGHRTFYLQARRGSEVVTLKLEKQQVATMSQFLGEILSDLPTPGEVLGGESLDLVEPVEAEWPVGRIQLAYDGDTDRIVILADELTAEEEPDPGDTSEELGTGRFALTRPQAAGVARRGIELVGAGRPTCMLCGHPIDPEGHSCPRTNGHRPPTP
jgi:uncharacterized repeat protein (TIGR03847 family)